MLCFILGGWGNASLRSIVYSCRNILYIITYIIIIIIIIEKDWQCMAGRGKLTPYQSEDPSPTLQT